MYHADVRFGATGVSICLLVAVGSCRTTSADADAGLANKLYLGRVCELGPTAGDSGAGQAMITSPALECATRVCLLPPPQRPTTTGPLCTATCVSDSDCADGEIGQGGSDPHCQSGFVCGVATTDGQFCCLKLCMCKDFFWPSSTGLPVPPECAPPSSCPNVSN